MPNPFFVTIRVAIVCCILGVASRADAEKSAADLVPKSALVYIEMAQPTDFIAYVLDHPLRREVEKSAAFRKGVESPDFQQFMAVVGVVEQRVGMSWRQGLEAMSGGGMAFAFDPPSKGVVLLAKPRDRKVADNIRDTIFALAREDAQNHGKPDPIQTTEYRGVTAYHTGELILANLGPWTMFCNKPDYAKAITDAFLDGGDTFGNDRDFAEARRLSGESNARATAWAFLRAAPLRSGPGNPPWVDPKYKSDNPVAEFLLGGLIPMFRKTPCYTASLHLDAGAIKLTVASPHDANWVTPERKFFFESPGDGAARPLMPDKTMLSISAYRDFPSMWRAGPDLFNEAIATKMAQTDSSLSTLFGGKSFTDDVLGALRPQIQLVVAAQDYKVAGVHKPGIRLPGAALVLSVKPESFDKLRRHFRVGFQSMIAFANIDGGQKGRPLLEIKTESRSGAEIQYATYEAIDENATKKSADKPESVREDVYLNFSPALVMSPKRMILCSTKEIAEELADLTAKGEADAVIPQNTMIRIEAAPILALVRDNHEQLVAQNMIDKGHDRATAEQEVGLLQTIIGAVRDASIRLTPTEKSIRLEVELTMNAGK